MSCGFYESCKKEFACCILGECVFYHDYLATYHPQAIVQIHYGKNCGAIANVLQRLKNGKDWRGRVFNGTPEGAQKHLDEVIFPSLLNSDQNVQESDTTDDDSSNEADKQKKIPDGNQNK